MSISFFDLNDTQISKLDQKSIERYIDYECAVEGIPLLPEKPVPPPNLPEHEPDATTFTLPQITVATQQEANRIIALVAELKLVRTNYLGRGYDTHYISGEERMPQLDIKRVFSKEMFDDIGDKLEEQKDLQSEYNRKKNEYDSADRNRRDILKRVNETLKEVKERFAKKDYLRLEWARYIDLAEGNAEIAYNFMKKVHTDLDLHPDLVEEFEIDRFMNV